MSGTMKRDVYVSSNKEKEYSKGKEYSNDKIEVYNRSFKPLFNMLKDDEVYEQVRTIFEDYYEYNKSSKAYNREYVDFCIKDDAGKTKSLSSAYYTKREIIQILSTRLLLGKSKKRFNELERLASYEMLKKNCNGKEWTVTIKGKEVTIPVSKFFKFLELDDKEYNEFVNDKNEENIDKKRVFAYCLNDFMSKNKILEEYVVPKKIKERCKDIEDSKNFDIEAFKSVRESTYTEKNRFDDVELNEDYKNYILSSIPKGLTKLEQAMHVYIMMCKSLSYDDEYYALNQGGTNKHVNIGHLKDINFVNNEVVCFEFNAMYAKFLNELGLKYDVYEQSGSYGHGHANLTFTDGKFVVKVDALTSIFDGDIFRCKINDRLEGLFLRNENEDSIKTFYDSLDKVYKNINGNKSIGINKFNASLEEYASTLLKEENHDYNRTDLFFEILENSGLKGMDNLCYMMHMKHKFFAEYELGQNFIISVIGNNKPNDSNKIRSSTVVFAKRVGMNENDYSGIFDYYVMEDDKIRQVSKDEIEEKFADETYSYISGSKGIPGIDPEKRKTSTKR